MKRQIKKPLVNGTGHRMLTWMFLVDTNLIILGIGGDEQGTCFVIVYQTIHTINTRCSVTHNSDKTSHAFS